jgi:thymidine kinase
MSDFVYSNEHTKMDMVGYLKIIIGPMWSGKSTEVIKIYKHNCIAQISTLVVNYEEDRRYHANKLSTHDKTMIPCKRYSNLRDLLKLPNLDFYKCFVIDEAQFFDDLYVVVEKLLEKNKVVYICGLDSDFKMKKFGHIIDLIPIADEVIKKQALCALCKNGKKASFTKRLSQEDVQKLIGTNNYIPVCRSCHK